MIGAIIGDIVGSVYEWHNIKTKEFDLTAPNSYFTDDSVMTCAVAQGLLNSDINDEENVKQNIIDQMLIIGRMYPRCGYGGNFYEWIFGDVHNPYNSYGNGAAMRVSPVAWMSDDIQVVLRLAKNVTEVTHNHPEGIKGAQATAAAILMARQKKSIDEIKEFIEKNYYKLDFTLDEIRDTYTFDVTCQGTVPQAIVAFIESESFEDAIRNAISIGGDSDTLAAITGSIAEAYYGVPNDLREMALSKLDNRLRDIVTNFETSNFTFDISSPYSDVSRLNAITEKDLERKEKYKNAIKFLSSFTCEMCGKSFNTDQMGDKITRDGKIVCKTCLEAYEISWDEYEDWCNGDHPKS